MVALFGLFAEVERDLISERTREGLASARAKGRLLGRPKGVLGKSRLDGKEEEIRLLLQKQVSKASIAKIVGVKRPTIHRFIKTRRLRPRPTASLQRSCVILLSILERERPTLRVNSTALRFSLCISCTTVIRALVNAGCTRRIF